MKTSRVGPPAPRPCASCPYRKDVPSGVWSEEEYEKLRGYDLPTFAQPPAVFLCHQQDRQSDRARVCAGWAGCHDGRELLAMRLAVATRDMMLADAEAVGDYVSPVPLFSSGAEAADHGMADIARPSSEALEAMRKIERVRTDLK